MNSDIIWLCDMVSIWLVQWICDRNVTLLDKMFVHKCLCHAALEFGTSVSWEGNGKSCDALATCSGPQDLSTASSRAKTQQKSTSPAFHE